MGDFKVKAVNVLSQLTPAIHEGHWQEYFVASKLSFIQVPSL